LDVCEVNVIANHRIAKAVVDGIAKSFEFAVHGSNDENISESLIEHGVWEPFETEIIRRVLTTVPAPTGQHCFVDCGANIGWYSVIAASLGGNVLAFEPMSTNAALWRDNVARNGVTEKATLVEAALGSHVGVATLTLSEKNQGDHRVALPSRQSAEVTPASAQRATIQVRVTTLDCELAEGALRPTLLKPTLLKLDTQGSELAILEGAKSLLDATALPPTIITEFWPYGIEEFGASVSALISVFDSLLRRGMHCFEIVEWRSCLVERTADELATMSQTPPLSVTSQGFTNLLFVNQAHRNIFADLIQLDVDWDAVARLESGLA
jgi:FkbM family methyltransferase